MTTEAKGYCPNKKIRRVFGVFIGYLRRARTLTELSSTPSSSVVPWEPQTYSYHLRFMDVPDPGIGAEFDVYSPALFFTEDAALEYAQYLCTQHLDSGSVYSVYTVPVYTGLSDELKIPDYERTPTWTAPVAGPQPPAWSESPVSVWTDDLEDVDEPLSYTPPPPPPATYLNNFGAGLPVSRSPFTSENT